MSLPAGFVIQGGVVLVPDGAGGFTRWRSPAAPDPIVGRDPSPAPADPLASVVGYVPTPSQFRAGPDVGEVIRLVGGSFVELSPPVPDLATDVGSTGGGGTDDYITTAAPTAPQYDRPPFAAAATPEGSDSCHSGA